MENLKKKRHPRVKPEDPSPSGFPIPTSLKASSRRSKSGMTKTTSSSTTSPYPVSRSQLRNPSSQPFVSFLSQVFSRVLHGHKE